MLTVLIRYKNGDRSGREVIIPAKSVEFIPAGSPSVNAGIDQPGLLVNHGVDAEGGFHLSLSDNEEDWRDVFVMNAQGQTVARYTL
jgi:hypothetical protein